MACFKPLDAYYTGQLHPRTNKPRITFQPSAACKHTEPFKIPCGQCIGCRLERSRQWAIRCSHEASLHSKNSFITLTYRELPPNGSLNKRDIQTFFKRLRKKKGKLRYYQCGEYGEHGTGRPHHHAILFGMDFSEDQKPFKKTEQGHTLYTSKTLTDTWGHGHCYIGEVTFQSTAYVARYIMKKALGESAQAKYSYEKTIIDPETGEILSDTLETIQPEYTTMSRRPGIGTDWLKKYQADVYPHDSVRLDNKNHRPPKFYDKQLELTDPSLFLKIKKLRRENAELHTENNTPERLKTREYIQNRKLGLLHRTLEKENT